jgi:hypothetical protein
MKFNNQKGTAAVEFAIILPVLLMLFAGTLEFGMLIYNKQVITNASREGARVGIVGGTTDTDIRDIVKNYCQNNLVTYGTPTPTLDDDAIDIETIPAIKPDFQPDLKVDIRYVYTYLLPSIFGFDPTITIEAFTLMKMEYDLAGA